MTDHFPDATKMVSEAPRLADALEDTDGAQDHEDAAAELRRLHHHELALKEWLDKTDWVQETSEARELGMHRADVLKQRIDRFVNTLAETHATYQAKLLQDEALLRQALACLTYAAPRHDCIDAAAEYERMSEATITALKERLK